MHRARNITVFTKDTAFAVVALRLDKLAAMGAGRERNAPIFRHFKLFFLFAIRTADVPLHNYSVTSTPIQKAKRPLIALAGSVGSGYTHAALWFVSPLTTTS